MPGESLHLLRRREAGTFDTTMQFHTYLPNEIGKAVLGYVPIIGRPAARFISAMSAQEKAAALENILQRYFQGRGSRDSGRGIADSCVQDAIAFARDQKQQKGNVNAGVGLAHFIPGISELIAIGEQGVRKINWIYKKVIGTQGVRREEAAQCLYTNAINCRFWRDSAVATGRQPAPGVEAAWEALRVILQAEFDVVLAADPPLAVARIADRLKSV